MHNVPKRRICDSAVRIVRDAAVIQAVILVVAVATNFVGLDELVPVGIVIVAAAAIGLLLSLERAITARPAPVAIYPPPPSPLQPPPPPPSMLDR